MSDRLGLFPLSYVGMVTLVAWWQRMGGGEWMSSSRRETS